MWFFKQSQGQPVQQPAAQPTREVEAIRNEIAASAFPAENAPRNDAPVASVAAPAPAAAPAPVVRPAPAASEPPRQVGEWVAAGEIASSQAPRNDAPARFAAPNERNVAPPQPEPDRTIIIERNTPEPFTPTATDNSIDGAGWWIDESQQ